MFYSKINCKCFKIFFYFQSSSLSRFHLGSFTSELGFGLHILPTSLKPLLLVQDNHNQDADGDHDDDGDSGDYGPFNSKYVQYNSSYDRILCKQICPSQHPAPPPPPRSPLTFPIRPVSVTNHWKVKYQIVIR